MKKNFFITAAFFCYTAVFAQTGDAARFVETITTADLKKHLTIIAGDEMEGRETGTPGQRKAAAYIETQYRNIGLNAPEALNGFQQLYPLFRDSMISSQLKINDKPLLYGTDYIIPAGSAETGKFNSKQLVFAGYGIDDSLYNDYNGLDVKGKIVLFFLGEPRKESNYLLTGTKRGSKWTYPGLSHKLAAAKKYGAAGVLVINPSQEIFSARSIETSKKTGIIFQSLPSGDKAINFAILSHAHGKTILGNLFDSLLQQARAFEMLAGKSTGIKKIKVSGNYKKFRDTIYASNIIGVVEGSDKKDEFVFITAHYDHLGKHDGKIYYGADDDGSGTCGVIEMAEAFTLAKKAGNGPRRSVVFMTVSGEEKGLWGSEYYSDHPVFPMEKTTVDLNIDMVGRIDTERMMADSLNYIYVIGHDKLSSNLAPIGEDINKKYTNLVLDYKFDDPNDQNRIYFRSDHYNFARKGVPILFYYDGMLQSDYHKPTDTVDKIYWDLYEKRVRLVFHTAWEIANRDDMLKRDIPLQGGSR